MWKGRAGHWPGGVGAVVVLLAGAVPAQETGGLAKAACDRAASEGLGKILDAIGIPSDKAGAVYDVWAAYLQNPDATRLKAVQDKIAGGLAGLVIPGYGVASAAGEYAIDGVGYTIATAEAMRVDALLCGGNAFGDPWPVGFFQLEATQQIAPGADCGNFAEKITTQRDFDRLKDLYWSYYVSKVLEFSAGAADRAEKHRRLEQMWQTLYLTWRVKAGARLDAALRAALAREAAAAVPGCGVNTADPANLPVPAAPPGGQYVLINTLAEASPQAPGTSVSAAPQKISFTAPYGSMECAWTAPPKAVSGAFEMTLQVSSTPATGQNLQAYIVARSGFQSLGGTPNEISGTTNEAYANGTAGIGETGYSSMKLGPGDVASAQPGQLLYLQVGGCGANVTYTYQFAR